MAINAENGRKSSEASGGAALAFTEAELEMLPGVFAELGVDFGSDDSSMKVLAEHIGALFAEQGPFSAYKLGQVATKLDAARGDDIATAWPVAIPAENVKRSTAPLTSSDQRLLELDPDIASDPSAGVDSEVLHAFFEKAIDETLRMAPIRRFTDDLVHRERLFVRTQWKSKPDDAADLVVRQGDKIWMVEVKLRSGQLELRAESGKWQLIESSWTAKDASGLSEHLLKLFQGDPDCVRATIETLKDGLEERV